MPRTIESIEHPIVARLMWGIEEPDDLDDPDVLNDLDDEDLVIAELEASI